MHTAPYSSEHNLEFLLKQGRDYAEFSMRKFGHIAPAMFASTPHGPLYFVPASLEDERAKNDFVNTARLVCGAYEAVASVMVLESWLTVAGPGHPRDPEERPSEAMDRQEVVVLLGEARTERRQAVHRIVRTDAGGFFGLTEFEGLPDAEFQGRFSHILPPKKPTPDVVKFTKAVLAVMGVTAQKLGQKPR